MNKKIILGGVMASLLLFQTSFAAVNKPGIYIKGVIAGNTLFDKEYAIRNNSFFFREFNIPSTKKLKLEGSNGASIGGAVGFVVKPDIRVEIAANHYLSLKFKYGNNASILGDSFGVLDYKATEVSTSLFVDCPINKRFAMFLNIGLGVSVIDGKYKDGYSFEGKEIESTIKTGKLKRSINISTSFGGGASYNVTSNVIAEIFANWKNLGEVEKLKSNGDSILRDYHSLTKAPPLSFLEAGIGIRYHF